MRTIPTIIIISIGLIVPVLAQQSEQESAPIKQKVHYERSLRSLRNIGSSLEGKLKLIGVHTIDDFLEADPYELYKNLEATLGSPVDRCVLYCFKGAQIDLPWYECKKFFCK